MGQKPKGGVKDENSEGQREQTVHTWELWASPSAAMRGPFWFQSCLPTSIMKRGNGDLMSWARNWEKQSSPLSVSTLPPGSSPWPLGLELSRVAGFPPEQTHRCRTCGTDSQKGPSRGGVLVARCLLTAVSPAPRGSSWRSRAAKYRPGPCPLAMEPASPSPQTQHVIYQQGDYGEPEPLAHQTTLVKADFWDCITSTTKDHQLFTEQRGPEAARASPGS